MIKNKIYSILALFVGTTQLFGAAAQPQAAVVSDLYNRIFSKKLSDDQAITLIQDSLAKKELANINELGINSMNLLHAAAWNKRPHLISYLLSIGADPSIKGMEGTALEIARNQGSLEIIKLLEQKIAATPAQNSELAIEQAPQQQPETSQATPPIRRTETDVIIAEDANKPEILALPEHNFGPQAKKPEPRNASSQADVVNNLIIKLTTDNANDATAQAAIRKAIEDGDLIAINTPRNNRGMTLLHWAADRGYPGVARYLLEQGADPARETASGMTALDIATTNKQREVAKLLAPITPQSSTQRKARPTGHLQLVLEHADQKITVQNIREIWKELTANNKKLSTDEIKQLIAFATDPDQATNHEKNRLWVLANNLIAANPGAIDHIKTKLDPITVDAWHAIIARKQHR